MSRRSRKQEVAVVVLAAGKGTRMKSSMAKVLHPLAGRPMLAYILDVARSLSPERLAVVVGYQAERVKEAFKGTPQPWTWVLQYEQRGTGDAVLAARDVFEDFHGTLLILYGDVPLLGKSTVEALLEVHHRGNTPVTILTAVLDDPTGYGRIVRNKKGTITRIVEELDASPAERELREINTGIYCIAAPILFEALSTVDADNAKKEYYLTDVVEHCAAKGFRVGWHETREPELALGINTRKDLARAEHIIRLSICEHWMLSGVTIADPGHTYIDYDVSVGMDTRIGPNCHLRGKTTVGEECTIEPGCVITDSTIGHRVTIRASSVLEGVTLEDGKELGPLVHVSAGDG